MANPKILETIQALSTEEQKEFLLYLKSPFVLQEDAAAANLRLFSCLLDTVSGQQMLLADKSALHAVVFPGKQYSAVRLERACLRLTQLIEQFLVTKHYLREGNEQRRALDLASIYREKRLAALYGKNLKKLKKMNEEALLDTNDNNLLRFQIALEEFEWHCTFNKAKGDLSIPAAIAELEQFFETTRVKLVNILRLQYWIPGFDIADKPGILSEKHLNLPHFESELPLYLVEKKINDLLLMPEPSLEMFNGLISVIKAHESKFEQETLKSFYTYVRNFCLITQKAGNPQLLPLLHQIHQDHLKRGYLHYNGQITPNTLLNIVAIAIKAGNVEWAKQVVESNRHNILAGEEAEELYQINRAICLFEEKRFDEALQCISFPDANPSYTLFARRLELKIYYELQSPLLPYKIDAFRKYLERTAPMFVSAAYRRDNLNFLHILAQLSRSKSRNAQRASRLMSRIEKKKGVPDRAWLLEKAQEIG